MVKIFQMVYSDTFYWMKKSSLDENCPEILSFLWVNWQYVSIGPCDRFVSRISYITDNSIQV